MRKNLLKKEISIGIIILFVGAGITSSAIGGNLVLFNTITVPDDYPTIQEAIDHSNDGDIIEVGFTIQNSGIDYLYNKAGIDIRSNYNIISDNNLGPNNMFGINIEGYSNNIIDENYININFGDGLHLSCSNNNTITGNTITNNVYDGICITNNCSERCV